MTYGEEKPGKILHDYTVLISHFQETLRDAKATIDVTKDTAIRLEEKVKEIKDGDKGDLPDLVRHMKELNGTVAKCIDDIHHNSKDIASVQASAGDAKKVAAVEASTKNLWKVISGILAAVAVIITALIGFYTFFMETLSSSIQTP